MAKTAPWIAVDLDGTLAYYTSGQGIDSIGPPIPAMLSRVRGWLARGITVKIMTARFPHPGQVELIQAYTMQHLGQALEVTDRKDFNMIQQWDDRAVTVRNNEGIPCCSYERV